MGNGNDPAFLFYPGDYLRDTQCLSANSQVAYDRIICEHMRNICITQQQLNFFTKRLNDEEKEELMMVLKNIDGGFQIEWVAQSIDNRRRYSESRRSNRTGKKKEHMNNISSTYVNHMENENEIEDESENEVSGGVQHKTAQTANPTKSEVVAFFVENGYRGEIGERAFLYYSEAGWVDSRGNKVRSWKQKMRSVWFKDEHKKPENEIDMVKAKKDADDFYNSRMGPADLRGFKITPEVEEDYEVDRSDEQGDET